MSTVIDRGVSAPSAAAERRFYVTMAAVMMVAVLVGFAPSFFLRPLLGPPDWVKPITPLVLLHGVLYAAWVVLFTAQVALVRSGRRDLHRRLGMLGAVLVPAMLVSGTISALGGVGRASGPPGIDPHAFLAVPLLALLGFVPLFALALHRRRDPQTHKRLMVMGMCVMMAPAFARIPVLAGPVGMVLMPTLLVLAQIIWDWRTRGRPHPASLRGGLWAVVTLALPLAIFQTPAWLAFAHWLVPG